MVLPVFPNSPVWANLSRRVNWSEDTFKYETGLRQGISPLVQPYIRYTINIQNMNVAKELPLFNFQNDLKGMAKPFLFKDPYDYKAEAVAQPVTTSMAAGSGFFAVDSRNWKFIPDSASMVIVAGDSGTLTNGIDYVMSQDNGFITVLNAVTSTWTASFEYFRKCAFEQPYEELSILWEQFTGSIVIEEMLPSNG